MRAMNEKELAESLKIIEENTCFRVTARTDKGVFLIPVDNRDIAYTTPEHFTYAKIRKLAEYAKQRKKTTA